MTQSMRYYMIVLSGLLLSGVINLSAYAQQHLFYKEINIIGGYADSTQWTGKYGPVTNSIGFEDYRRLSNDYGDFLTTDLQVRLAYDSLADSRNAWELQVHNAWAQFNLGGGKKITIGHFDPAFGLEPVVDTHAALLQTLAERNIGYKKDWGAGFKGFTPWFDYEAALQLGSGPAIYRRDDSFLSTVRLSRSPRADFEYGLSILYGNVLRPGGMGFVPRDDLLRDHAIVKKRIGLDGQYRWGALTFKGEAVYGSDDHDEVAGAMAQVDYALPRYPDIGLQAQIMSMLHDIHRSGTDDTTFTLGASYQATAHITLRMAYMKDTDLSGGSEDEKVIFQFYFFG